MPRYQEKFKTEEEMKAFVTTHLNSDETIKKIDARKHQLGYKVIIKTLTEEEK